MVITCIQRIYTARRGRSQVVVVSFATPYSELRVTTCKHALIENHQLLSPKQEGSPFEKENIQKRLLIHF